MLTGSVGLMADNRAPDVRAVQRALNRHVAKLGLSLLIEDGRCGAKTIDSIRSFQGIALRAVRPDGLIAPHGPTARALGFLAIAAPAPTAIPATTSRGTLSGSAWWRANQARWQNENRVSMLSEPFKSNVTKFIAALEAAGARVAVSATTRSLIRAKLMRYSWDIAKGIVQPNATPAIPGVDIIWDHGNLARSKEAASEMVALFQIVKQPSLQSNHLAGNAIDMTISWTGDMTIVSADQKTKTLIGSPRNGTNAKLHVVGATYAVLHKLPDDPPHWSTTGR